DYDSQVWDSTTNHVFF
nr:immunoglobulin light chain junction region [Macaca mulatta]